MRSEVACGRCSDAAGERLQPVVAPGDEAFEHTPATRRTEQQEWRRKLRIRPKYRWSTRRASTSLVDARDRPYAPPVVVPRPMR